MNAGVFFQTLSGSTSAVRETVTQKVNQGNESKSSFKKEIDKAFNKEENSSRNVHKDTKSSFKKNLKDDQIKDKKEQNFDEVTESGKQDDNSIKRMQELAVLQLQNGLSLQELEENCNGLQNLQDISEGESLLGQSLNSNLVNNLDEDLGLKEGKTLLTPQNNVDLVKAALLKLKQGGEEQKQPMITLQPKEEMLVGNQAKEVTNLEKTLNGQNFGEEIENSLEKNQETPKEANLINSSNLDLSKINIKVGETPVNTTRTDMANQLADKILYKLSNGKQEFDLELYPKNLGKVNVKLIFQNGGADLIMTTSNSKAHQLLSQHVDALKSILENNTNLNSTVNVKEAVTTEGQFDRDNFQEQSNNQQNQQQKQEKHLNEDFSFADKLRLGLLDEFEQAV